MHTAKKHFHTHKFGQVFMLIFCHFMLPYKSSGASFTNINYDINLSYDVRNSVSLHCFYECGQNSFVKLGPGDFLKGRFYLNCTHFLPPFKVNWYNFRVSNSVIFSFFLPSQ